MTDSEIYSETSVEPVLMTAVATPIDQASRAEGDISRWIQSLTISDGIMALLVALAGLLRFSNLGLIPLSPAEAENALASWQFWQSDPVTATVSSPAYFTFTNALLAVLGDSDATMRLAPALFGVAMVALLWLLRRHWQPTAMLTAALFLALSPLNVFAGRQAGGQSIAMFALLLLAIALWRMRGSAGIRWPATAGAALALGLTSDPVFYSGLVTFAVAWLLTGGARSDADEPEGADRQPTAWRAAALSGGATLLLVSTSFLLYPEGLGDTLRVGTRWLSQYGWPAATPDSLLGTITAPFAALARYEPALWLLGLPALISAVAGRRSGQMWLAVWAGLLVVLSVLQVGVLSNALALTLPGYLLIGTLAGHLAHNREAGGSNRITLLVAGGLVLLGAVLLVSVARFTRLGLWSTDQAALLGLAVAALVAAGAVVVLALSYDQSAARLGTFIGLAVWLIYAQWGTAYQLSQPGANDPRERWISEATDSDVLTMMQLVADVSRQVTNSDNGLQLVNLVDTPVLDWYLRDFERAQSATTVPLQSTPEALITPVDAETRFSADYVGADFGLAVSATPGAGQQLFADRLRWWLFRESDVPVQNESVIFWVRSDLVEP